MVADSQDKTSRTADNNHVDNRRVYFWNGVDELVRFDASNREHLEGDYPAVFVSEHVSKELFDPCPLDPMQCIVTKDGEHHVIDPEGQEQVNDLAKWDVKALKQLLKSVKEKA